MPDRRAIVPRRRCLAALRRLHRQIIWIAAPAGTGKSHLLQQIADQFYGQVVSLQIEEADSDPGRLFHRLTRSLRALPCAGDLPDFGAEDLTYLRSFAGAFFERLSARAGSGLLLALDDMHLLNQATELLNALAAGVSRASDRISFAIASREAPPSSWAPFTAEGRLAEVGLDMLLMDADEVRELLVAHPDWHHGTDERVVDDLLAATKGWASGIGVLIALSKARPAPHEPFGRSEAQDSF